MCTKFDIYVFITISGSLAKEVSEEKIKMWKVYRRTTDQVMAIAHVAFGKVS
jgi:hypothetical protein